MFPNLSIMIGTFFTMFTSLFSGVNQYAEAFEVSGKIVNNKAQTEYNRHKTEMDTESIEQKQALTELRHAMESRRQAQLDAKAS